MPRLRSRRSLLLARHPRRGPFDVAFARAAGIDMPFVEFHDTDTRGIGPHVREGISREQAVDALGALIALRREGLQRPLPFAPYSAWEFFAADGGERGLRDAAKKWRGGERQWAEGDSESLRLALRGHDPFADAATADEFARIAGIVFGAVTKGDPAPIELGEIALPEDDDAEDAE
jgi:exodeoxyribonuclease V gamma subunit